MSDSRSYDHRTQAGRMQLPSGSRRQRLPGEDGHYPRPSRYDDSSYRGGGRPQQVDQVDNGEDHERSSRRRSHRDRSRSRSPPSAAAAVPDRDVSAKDDLEAARRQRMARLRAENDEEERRLQAFDRQQDHADATNSSTKKTSSVNDTLGPEDLEGMDEMEQMKLLMGLEGFGSTKGQKVEDNHKTSARGAAAKNKARKYRQYMNRKVRTFRCQFFSESLGRKTFVVSLCSLNFV